MEIKIKLSTLKCLKISKACLWDKLDFNEEPVVQMCFLKWTECVTAAGVLRGSGRSQCGQRKKRAFPVSAKAARLI